MTSSRPHKWGLGRASSPLATTPGQTEGKQALGVGGGAAFSGVGVFALVAAIRFDPHQTNGMDDTPRKSCEMA